MIVRKAFPKDQAEIERIYARARSYMTEHGNPGQWEPGYPTPAVIEKDISDGNCYLLEEDGTIHGVFAFFIGEDPAYRVIKEGAWHCIQPLYGVIHRVASAGKKRGMAEACFDYCSGQADYLRIDTHKDNRTMQAVLQKYGFSYCGIVYVRNGERMAFDYSKSHCN